MAYDQSNIFAKIIKKEIPANIVFEDDKVLAFEDISRAAPTHILVIPKEEYVDLVDFSTNASVEDVAYFFKKVSEIAKELQIIHSGFRVISNIGTDAHQSVKHFHVHILAGKQLGPLLKSDNLER
ncbi:MAG: HIT domain-containing protein [Rickettsiales bacterium]|nr:HIT domain-containing protein [Rickettsiales bacterium]